MKRINLLTHYEPEALFRKASKQIQDQVEQWPGELDFALDPYVRALKDCVLLTVPKVDFRSGREVQIERIYPLSELQSGAKPGALAKLNVLVFKYPIVGQTFLMGCRPAGDIPEPPGEWYADLANNEIRIEYKWYERNPRKVIATHKAYIERIDECYRNLTIELAKLNQDIEALIDEVVQRRREELNRRRQMLSLLQ